jgi:hypothetical protein
MANENSEPTNDMSPLAAGAIQMHELYQELKRAGFTRREALDLIARSIVLGAGSAIEDAREDD